MFFRKHLILANKFDNEPVGLNFGLIMNLQYIIKPKSKPKPKPKLKLKLTTYLDKYLFRNYY